MSRIIAASALSLLMATSAFAQSTTTFDATQSGVFMNEQGSLRASTEAKSRFEALPADQQAEIRTICTQYRAASTGGSGSTDTTGSTTSTTGTTGTTGSTGTTGTTGSASTTGSGSTSGATTLSMADMGQACDMVESF